MIIRRSRRFTVNMGNYESYTFGAEVEMEHHDLGISDAKLLTIDREALKAKLTKAVLDELEAQLLEEVSEAQQLSKEKRSFIKQGFGLKEPPRRRRRLPNESDSPYS